MSRQIQMQISKHRDMDLQVDDQVGRAVERERGVAGQEREPATWEERSGRLTEDNFETILWQLCDNKQESLQRGEIRNWRKIDRRTTLRQFCDNFGTTSWKACSRGGEIKNWRQIGVFRAKTWQARRRSSAPGFMKLTWRCLPVVQASADFALLLHNKPGSNNETLKSWFPRPPVIIPLILAQPIRSVVRLAKGQIVGTESSHSVPIQKCVFHWTG